MKRHTVILPKRTLIYTDAAEALLALKELYHIQRIIRRQKARVRQYLDKVSG